MCLDDLNGEEVSKGEDVLVCDIVFEGFFFSILVSDLSQDSTTESKFDEPFKHSTSSDSFSCFFSVPSWMYTRSVAQVSNPSKM